jgi:hypothetical protein
MAGAIKDLMKERLPVQGILHTDEISLQVLREPGPRSTAALECEAAVTIPCGRIDA